MKYKQPQHHRSRGKATLPAPPNQRPGAEGVVSAAKLCSVIPPAKCDALPCDSARLALCLAELLGPDASQMYSCHKVAS